MAGAGHSVNERRPAANIFGDGILMSDFFTRLAELSLGDARGIRPEIVPRFAQGPEVAPDVSQSSLWVDPLSEQSSAPKLPQPPARPQSPEASQTPLPSQSPEATDEGTLSQTAAAPEQQPPNQTVKPPTPQTFSIQTGAEGSVEASAEGDSASSTKEDFEHSSSLADVSTEASHTAQTPPRAEAAPPAEPRQERDDQAKSPTTVSHAPAETVLQLKEDARATASPELDALTHPPSEPSYP